MSDASSPTVEIFSEEIVLTPNSGWRMLGVLAFSLFALPFGFIIAGSIGGTLGGLLIVVAIIATMAVLLAACGFMAIQPNQARVLLLFGDYKGSVRESGFYWVNPFYSKKKVSLRVRNFETGSSMAPEEKDPNTGRVIKPRGRTTGKTSKVNDRDGNPIEISAVVVWKVTDTAEALFNVDDYEDFVAVQSESALRNLAMRYPYDSSDSETSLRGDTKTIATRLQEDIQARVGNAGVTILESQISHLAYAPEIAAAMLQRQQAGAVVAARTRIVDGAVGMVDMALEHLKRDNIVELTDEQRATLVSNLLVVLCSDRHTQPVVQAGS
ncbi:MAG: SPFH domain-containing protein [Planctomycetota bacterium]